MAKAPSKRKKPPREKHVLKEIKKIASDVFDRPTLLVLAKLLKKGIFASVDFPISTGKEANVFRATTKNGSHLAVKIYKIETALFSQRIKYLEGDPRFKKIKYNTAGLVYAFARKEFKNLKVCERARVHAPKPIYVLKNVVVMSFLGEGGLPYPTMDVVGPRNEKDLDSVLKDMKKMYRVGLVHADISKYNLMLGNVPHLIDFGQGVITQHPHAEKFLERDLYNILHYFAKFGYKKDSKKVLRWIKG